MNYEEFIKSKQKQIIDSGFDIDESELNKNLFLFQKFIVKKALKKGKYAIFADCGLGKTLMQLEWAKQVSKQDLMKPVLVLCPLAVAKQTIKEGEKFGIKVGMYGENTAIQVSNYEQLDNIDASKFAGVVLDESSILKNFTGKIRNQIITTFEETKYKLACTATPSPNDPMELGNHAEFLNVMTRNEMLSMYFVHDGGETAKWRLKGHAVEQFYKWVGSWSIMLNKPSDIGFCDDGYVLPGLEINNIEIETEKKDNGKLFNDKAISATNFNKELKDTLEKRMDVAADIVNKSDENFIVWIKQDAEADYIKKLIPDAVEVRGSTKNKADLLIGFANNEFRVLITKTKIAQFGLNYQNCHNQIFASLDFSFEGLYQAIRRSYRFGQKDNVKVTVITTDTMHNVSESIDRKEKEFKKMQDEMAKNVNAHIDENEDLTIYSESIENEYFKIENGDCVEKIKNVESESVGFSVFSPPFAELYTYSDNIKDMGNSNDYKEFLTQFNFLVKELFRVIKSGRNVAVHCMDLPIQKGKEGFIGLRDFSGMMLKVFGDAGFIYHSRITIWKDPVIEMQRTKALGLLHKQVKKDSTMSRVGIPDYIMVFRKDGEREDPVTNTDISVDEWQKIASPVWNDINYSKTLNLKGAREEKDEKHICPLQLDTIKRLIKLYTNEGDTVLTPFLGIGSEVYQAVKMKRKGIGFELKNSYYNVAVKNCLMAVDEVNTPTLF